jgi:cytochrome c-type biogenesis protein
MVFIVIFYVFEAVGVTLVIEHRRPVEIACGSLITVLGLNTLGVIRLGLLMRDLRVHLDPRGPSGLAGAFALGVTFAAGWSPCIGPQLGLILTVAAQRDFAGLPVMLVYAAGLAVPFLLAAVLADRAQGVLRALNRHLGAVNLVAGFILVTFGVLLALGNITSLNRFGAPIDL